MIVYADAEVADGAALTAMAGACWAETFAHSCSAEDLALYLAGAFGPEGQLLADLAAGEDRFRIAREDGRRIVGYAKVGVHALPAPDAMAGAVDLRQLYVLRPWQGAGVAATLMDWAMAEGRRRGAPEMYLSVWEENARAIAFYRRRGFVHVGEYAFRTGNQIDRDLVLRIAL